MSFLRNLTPGKGAWGSSSRGDGIKLRLIVPGHGTVFIQPPADDPLWPRARSAGPKEDHVLRGLLEVFVPEGSTRRRCRSIRVGVRTRASLKLSPERGWEEDTIFNREVELVGGPEGVLLEEGSQRFEFTIILPSTLAPHDWHHNAKVHQELHAEVEGAPAPRSGSTSGLFGARSRGSKTSLSAYRDQHRDRSPSRSPARTPLTLSPRLTPTGTSPIGSPEGSYFPLDDAPGYEETEGQRGRGAERPRETDKGKGKERPGEDWILGSNEITRNIMVVHNPDPQGGVSDLDERQSGWSLGVGEWNLRIVSDIFSIGGPVHAGINLSEPSDTTTVYCARLLTRQTHSMRSPRDDGESITSSRSFITIEHGQRPPPHARNPDAHYPALWRGKGAGGSDEGMVLVEGNGSMPKDDRGRPTTLPGIDSPVHVSHTFVYELFFSVWGMDEHGRPLPKPGPGGLRVLQIERAIILPSCVLIPSVLNLPEYFQNPCDVPCPTCGMQRRDQICATCPPTLVPHPRHDHPAALVGSKDGVCPACSEGISTGRDITRAWDLCACGGDVGEIGERMRKFALEGVRADFEDGAVTGGEAIVPKRA